MTPPTSTVQTLLSDFRPWIDYGLVAALCRIAPHRRARRVRIMDAVGALFALTGVVSTLALHSPNRKSSLPPDLKDSP